ncbi:MAG: hypothetical protein ACRC9F_01480 [Metamycoplasmataceae bacterium]
MNKSELTKINNIKSNMVRRDKYKEYKSIFKNKQTRFLLSKMAIIFESWMSDEDLSEIELSFMNNPTQDHLINTIDEISKTFNEKFINLEWKKFGICLWYVFQMSIFYNKRRKIPCEYTVDNFVSLNNIKRYNFAKWLKSLYESENIDFNKYVIKVLEIII